VRLRFDGVSIVLPPATPGTRDRALDVLLGSELEPIVDMVGWSPAPGVFEVGSADGHVCFARVPDGTRWQYEVKSVTGANPLADQDPQRFGTLNDERAVRHPHRRDNTYPWGYEQFAQVWDHGSAPDLCVVHAAAHNWEEAGGHLGEHGSPGVIQARAPFIACGAGIQQLGMVDRACRLIDFAPTVLRLLGAGNPDCRLRHEDGFPLTDILDGRPCRHVVGFLLDGTNTNVLYDLAARGEAPNIARLMAAGVTFRYGALASLPTVTLANHTAILTGLHPGHHGILHNAWVDRATGEQVVTNSPATWVNATQWLDPRVETLHVAVKRLFPGSFTASVNEPCDAGADFSTFDRVRRGEALERPPAPNDLPDATERFVRPSKDYRWSSRIDHTAVQQAAGIWSGSYLGASWPLPAFTWVNFTLTDAAFHEGGPYSEMAASSVRDTDARVGHVLDSVERAGKWDETAFFVVADHGMQETNPGVRGDWDEVLRAAGIAVRDEGYGFLYFPEG
jgi:hypothetical protein